MDHDVHLATIIRSLPPEFGKVMEAWELADPSQRTKQNLISKLLNKEVDLKYENPVGSALAVQRWSGLHIEELNKRS